MTSKCGKNISDTLGCASCATFLFLPHFDVICDLLLNRRTATWNLFVLYNKELKYTGKSLFIPNFATLTDTKIARRETCFSSLPPVYRNCPRPRQGFFLNLHSPSQLNFQNFPPFLKKQRAKVLMMTSSMRLSSNRLWVRTNQNARITWVTI